MLDRQSKRTAMTARAAELAAAGWSCSAIADELGVVYSTVWGWLNPDKRAAHRQRDNAVRSAAKRAWENANRRVQCERCGATAGVAHSDRAGRWCIDCYCVIRRAERLERAREIERRWADGESLAEIAPAVGLTEGSLGVEMCRLRAEGLADLPYRYRMSNGRRVAA